MNSPDPAVADFIRQVAADDRYAAYLRNVLLELCAINTAPDADPVVSADREKKLFDWIERELGDLLGDAVRIERVPIADGISADPAYCPAIYAADASGCPLPAERVYANRSNLEACVPGQNSSAPAGVLLSAAVDVSPNWHGPRSSGSRIFGRGAAENKAQVAMLLAQIKLLKEVEERLGRQAEQGRLYGFVIDSDIGGNGALSQAMGLERPEMPVVVHEPTALSPVVAAAGAVEYCCRLSMMGQQGAGAMELMPLVIEALEDEGRKLREETNAPPFDATHVSTCHGVLGGYGFGSTSVCDHVSIEILARSKANPERVGMKLVEFLDQAMADYVRVYGDKTRQNDPATGKPMVHRHFELKVQPTADTQNFVIDFYGRTGHSATASTCDNAITKAAYGLGTLLRIAPSFPGVQAHVRLADGSADGGEVVIRGVQFFSLVHDLADVESRMASAVQRAARQFCQLRGIQYDAGLATLSFEGLRVKPFVGDDSSSLAQVFRGACDALGETCCEQRASKRYSSARMYQDKAHSVIVFGAGTVEQARISDEYIDLSELQRALAISTLTTWMLIA